MPKLTVVTCTYNRKDSLKETMETVFYKQNLPLEDFEYLVVDDGDIPLEDLHDTFSDREFKIIRNRGNGLAAGRNTGAYAAKGDIVLFLDDDIIIDPDHLIKHIEDHQRFDRAIITADRSEREDLTELLEKTPFGRYKAKHDYIWHDTMLEEDIDARFSKMVGLAGFSSSVKKQHFLEIGDFDERMPYAGNEDFDFYLRAKSMGFDLIWDRENPSFHNEKFNAERKNWLRRHFTGIQGYALLASKHNRFFVSDFYQFNAPMSTPGTSKQKRARMFRALVCLPPVRSLIYGIANTAEALSLPDSLLFRLYNLLYIIEVQRGFRIGYKRYLGFKAKGEA